MKLKEWGFVRHKSRKGGNKERRGLEEGRSDENEEESADEVDAIATVARETQVVERNMTLLEEAQESVYPFFDLPSHKYHIKLNST